MKYWIIITLSAVVLVGAIIAIILSKTRYKYADRFWAAMAVFTIIAIIAEISAWYGLSA